MSDQDPVVGPFSLADLIRFCGKIEVPLDSDGNADALACWPWAAGKSQFGYGSFWSGSHGHSVGAHVVAALIAFGPPPEGKPFTLHACDNPACCNPVHLRYGTALENAQDRDGRGRHPRGEQHTSSKLTENDVRTIRAAHAGGSTLAELGHRYGVTACNIRSIVDRRTWKAVA